MRRNLIGFVAFALVAAAIAALPARAPSASYSESFKILGPLNINTIGVTRRDTSRVLFIEGKDVASVWMDASNHGIEVRDSTITFQFSMNCSTWVSYSATVDQQRFLGVKVDPVMPRTIGARNWSVAAPSPATFAPIDTLGFRYGAFTPLCMRVIVLWQADTDTAIGGTLDAGAGSTANLTLWARVQERLSR